MGCSTLAKRALCECLAPNSNEWQCIFFSFLYNSRYYRLTSAALWVAAGDMAKPALSCIEEIADVTGVWAPAGAGVLVRVTGALLLCAM